MFFPGFHICTGTVTNDKNPEGGGHMASGPWLRRNCWGQWVMFNKEKLSVADHDSCLQVNAGLSCPRGTPDSILFQRQNWDQWEVFRRMQISCQCKEKLSYGLNFLYLLFLKAMPPGKDSSRTGLSIHSDALRGNVCVGGKIELLNLLIELRVYMKWWWKQANSRQSRKH